MKGKVYLVGAGPGDPELLTIKALRILKSADAVLHDDLISPEILALVPRTAFVCNVGKRCGKKSTPQAWTNSLLVSLARSGLQVVRLKGGDPFVFGRGGEEMEALGNAGIECEIVPGITAALGAAAAAQIPLTHRKLSSALVFLTGHHANRHSVEDWRGLVSSKATLVIYMPGNDYETISRKLREAGMNGQTPCAIIARATTSGQQVYRTTVAELALPPHVPAPALLIAGEVAGIKSQVLEHNLRAALSGQEPFRLHAKPAAQNPDQSRERPA